MKEEGVRDPPKLRTITVAFLVPLAFHSTKIAIPLKILSSGISVGMMIVPVLANNFIQMWMRPTFGYLAEKHGMKRVFSPAPMLYALAMLTFLIAFKPAHVYLAEVLLAVGISAFWPPFLAYVSLLSSRHSESIGAALSVSFLGGLVGSLISGYIFEFGGYTLAFIWSSAIFLAASLASLTLPDIRPPGAQRISVRESLRRSLHEAVDLLLKSSSTSLAPIVNTYAPVILINAGLSPGATGVVLTALPTLSAAMQRIGGRFYERIVALRSRINLAALILLAGFALAVDAGVPYLVALFVAYSAMSSLLLTPQASKAVDSDKTHRASGVAGFGLGLTLGRVTGSAVATVGGLVSEGGLIAIFPASAALLMVSAMFSVITVADSFSASARSRGRKGLDATVA